MTLRPLLAVLWLWPGVALAGMPFVHLTDLAEQRLEALSFFLGLFLLVTLAVKALWNRLARDVPRLPRLGFGAALALVFLWTLGFQLVLSMIAGGRELMTPGAWEKSGTTYALKGAPPLSDTEWMLQARRQRLEELRDALWVHASQHGQRFPASDLSPELPEARWRVVGGSGLHFIYVGGQSADSSKAPLAYEPGLFGPSRWVLFTDGDIRQMPLRNIHAALEEGAP